MPPPLSDRDRADVERVLGGDSAAFGAIVGRWQKPLINLAFRFCRHRGRAEEMAQDAFVRAFRSLHQWRREAAFSTWLFALALNVFRSQMRQAAPRETSLGEYEIVAPQPSPETGAATHELDDLVRRVVSTLPPKYRDALILFYFLDQDVNQAAGCLGVPSGTLKARLHRGRALVKERVTSMLDVERKR